MHAVQLCPHHHSRLAVIPEVGRPLRCTKATTCLFGARACGSLDFLETYDLGFAAICEWKKVFSVPRSGSTASLASKSGARAFQAPETFPSPEFQISPCSQFGMHDKRDLVEDRRTVMVHYSTLKFFVDTKNVLKTERRLFD